MIQLRTGHAPLNLHLHRLRAIESPKCPYCRDQDETIRHYLYQCDAHRDARTVLINTLGRDAHSTEILYGTKKGVKGLLQYIADTERFKATFGDVSPINLHEDEGDEEQLPPDNEEHEFEWDDIGLPNT